MKQWQEGRRLHRLRSRCFSVLLSSQNKADTRGAAVPPKITIPASSPASKLKEHAASGLSARGHSVTGTGQRISSLDPALVSESESELESVTPCAVNNQSPYVLPQKSTSLVSRNWILNTLMAQELNPANHIRILQDTRFCPHSVMSTVGTPMSKEEILLDLQSQKGRGRPSGMFSPAGLGSPLPEILQRSQCLLTSGTIIRRMFSDSSSPRFGSVHNRSLTELVLSQTRERETRYHSLLSQMENGGLTFDALAEMGKEVSKLEPVVVAVQALRAHIKSQETVWEVAGDEDEEEDMREMAREEAVRAEAEGEELLREVLKCILPKDEADVRDCILEVRAGTGGDEAALFAMDLFTMYSRYCSLRGWRFESLEVTESAVGGYKEASAAICGEGAFGLLKFECGVHRVQRVPATERAGRVHTSAASVAVLPQADDVDVLIRDQDLRIDTYRSGGAGGQSVNTTNSAVRITHVPSGIVVAIQDERSQHQNKAKALKVLRARLFAAERERKASARSELRSNQIGSGDRSERIRTYNFPQGRVTDHRVGLTLHDMARVLSGEGLDEFLQALVEDQERQAVASLQAPKL